MSPVSPRRAMRINCPFSKQQATWIILQYGELKNTLSVKRKFRLHFKVSPFKVPHITAFDRLVARFSKTGVVSAKSRTGGKPIITDEMVQEVKDFLLPHTTSKQVVSLQTMANTLGISHTTAWRTVREKTKLVPLQAQNRGSTD